LEHIPKNAMHRTRSIIIPLTAMVKVP
jgi:hypothetical protein